MKTRKYKISATKWESENRTETGVIFWYKMDGRKTFDIFTSKAKAINAANKWAANRLQILQFVETLNYSKD